MPTYKVVFTKTNTLRGYIEADDVQDLSNKLWWPHTLNEDGTINIRYAPAATMAFEAFESTTESAVKSAEQVGDTLTSVTPLPDAVKPSDWGE